MAFNKTIPGLPTLYRFVFELVAKLQLRNAIPEAPAPPPQIILWLSINPLPPK